MNKLFLFDIDNTLITNKSEKAFGATLQNVHGIAVDDTEDFSGSTDSLILAQLLRSKGWDDVTIQEGMTDVLKELESVFKSTFDKVNIQVVPGAAELLAALKERGVVLGLITGNIKAIAQTKLESVGLYDYFTLGGFGDDPHEARSDLVTLAIKRAGYEDNLDNVYVIGDTERDIKATLDAGVKNAVGVSNGFRTIERLKQSGASIVLENFNDTDEAIRQFRL